MNYSLVGKARVAAKSQLKAAKAFAANIAAYSIRENQRHQKVLVFGAYDKNGNYLIRVEKGRFIHNVPLKVS
jgi:hypothetical protein